MSEKDSRVRIYIIDKPSFLSAGRAYVTNSENGIIFHDNNQGVGPLKLVSRREHDMPYTLAPYSIRDHKWEASIRKGTRVYPSCDVDTPGGWPPKKDEIPVILDMILLSQEALKDYVASVKQQAQDYRARVASDLKKVDENYGKRKKEIEAKIRAEKAEVRRRHIAPDLVQLVLKHSKNRQ